MEQATAVRHLAAHMSQRGTGNPLVLFLGAGCARAAGVPSLAEAAQQAHTMMQGSDVSVDPADDPVATFQVWLRSMSRLQQYSVLQRLYGHVPVPLFYQDLAALVKAGYFRRIFTTSIDTLLEQALIGAGLRRGDGFRVISLNEIYPPLQVESEPDLVPSVDLIKLAGDLDTSKVTLDPNDVNQLLRSQRELLRDELSADMLMVGYECEHKLIDMWLAHAESGSLWWVSSEIPAPEQMAAIEAAREVRYISGELAEPALFFSCLAPLVLAPSEANTMLSGDEEPLRSGEDVPTGALPLEEPEEAAGKVIGSQIHRSLEVLLNLEQTKYSGTKSPALQGQIDYQRQQVSELEDRYRSLAISREQILSILGQIGEIVQRAGEDPQLGVRVQPGTVDFLQSQYDVVRNQYSEAHPNHDVVSAAIGATVVLANRLGADIVQPDLVHELSMFSSSMTNRRV